jgi:hypothetical protein
MLGGAAFLLNFAPDRITLVQDLNIQMVGGRNENGYRRQCGVPVAVVGRRSRKRAQKAADEGWALLGPYGSDRLSSMTEEFA